MSLINIFAKCLPGRSLNTPLFKQTVAFRNKEDVLNHIQLAITETNHRIEHLEDKKQRGIELSLRQGNRLNRLTGRIKGIHDLKTKMNIGNDWKKFGGFTGWSNKNDLKYWVPTSSGYGQFHGWIDRSDNRREVSILEKDSNEFKPASSTSYKPKRNIISRISHFFKGTDGWDELGSGIGQTLPGIGQHVATTVMLSVLAPFVYLGVKGMHEEMMIKKKQFEEIIKKDHTSLTSDDVKTDTTYKSRKKLFELLELAQSMLPFISNGESADTLEIQAIPLDHPEFEIKMCEQALPIRRAIQKRVSQLAYEATPFGLLAMSGMFGGMITGTLASGAQIADSATKHIAALNTVADVFTVATAGLFMPAQLAMIVYGGKKAKEGKTILKALDEQRQILKNISPRKSSIISIDDKMYTAAKKNLHRLRRYHKRGKVLYGRGMQISEAGMLTGGSLSLAGLGIPGMAVLIPSALSTIGFAGYRLRQENRLQTFVGTGDHHILADKNLTLTEEEMNKNDSINKINTINNIHEITKEDLAETKIQSLILRGLSQHIDINDLKTRLNGNAQKGKWSLFRRTTLAPDVIESISEKHTKKTSPSLALLHSDVITKKSRSDILHQLATIVFKDANSNLSADNDISPDQLVRIAVNSLRKSNLLSRFMQCTLSIKPKTDDSSQRQKPASDVLRTILMPDDKQAKTNQNDLPQWRDALLLAAMRIYIFNKKDQLKSDRQQLFYRLYSLATDLENKNSQSN